MDHSVAWAALVLVVLLCSVAWIRIGFFVLHKLNLT